MNKKQFGSGQELPDTWRCPVCKASKPSIAYTRADGAHGTAIEVYHYLEKGHAHSLHLCRRCMKKAIALKKLFSFTEPIHPDKLAHAFMLYESRRVKEW